MLCPSTKCTLTANLSQFCFVLENLLMKLAAATILALAAGASAFAPAPAGKATTQLHETKVRLSDKFFQS